MVNCLFTSKFIWITVFLVYFAHNTTSEGSISNFDDSILFRVRWLTKEILDDVSGYEKMELLTTNNEKYQCLIPISHAGSEGNEKLYDGPNELQLLKPLFDLKSCTILLPVTNFWSYELCHGKSVTQFHSDPLSSSSEEEEIIGSGKKYNLGTLDSLRLKEMMKKLSERSDKEVSKENLPRLNIEGVSLAYFEVEYSEGDPCDLTGNPRISRVRYVCKNDGLHSIYSIKEVFTCEYEIIVLTFYLCRHPHYRPLESPQINLDCVPTDFEGKDHRPKNLQKIEKESTLLRSYLMTMENNLERGTLVDKLLPQYSSGSLFDSLKKEKEQPADTSSNELIVNQFLQGEFCLHGESGWWKYEFCYGKYVRQYREHSRKSKVVVLLGNFNLEAHKTWFKENGSKKAVKPQSVVHLYSGGDYCDDIRGKRSVEVKMKCSGSGSSWSLSLVETKVCAYKLVVESALLCPLMDHLDEWNLFSREDFMRSRDKGKRNVGAKTTAPNTVENPKETKKTSNIEDMDLLMELFNTARVLAPEYVGFLRSIIKNLRNSVEEGKSSKGSKITDNGLLQNGKDYSPNTLNSFLETIKRNRAVRDNSDYGGVLPDKEGKEAISLDNFVNEEEMGGASDDEDYFVDELGEELQHLEL